MQETPYQPQALLKDELLQGAMPISTINTLQTNVQLATYIDKLKAANSQTERESIAVELFTAIQNAMDEAKNNDEVQPFAFDLLEQFKKVFQDLA